MIKKRLTYTDYNGEKKTQDFYFNFNEAELIEMNMYTAGGLQGYIRQIIDTKDTAKLANIFKSLLLKSYGEKTGDGLFMKSPEIAHKLECSAAYPELYMGLLRDTDSAIAFIKGLIPANMVAKLPKDIDAKISKAMEEGNVEDLLNEENSDGEDGTGV